MEVTYICQAASARRPNDDFVLETETFVIVLDGATEPAGVESGCVHDVPWLVAHLGTNLAGLLVRDSRAALVDVVREGIAVTMRDHTGKCDLQNPDSPSSTVAILRCGAEVVDYIVLGDSRQFPVQVGLNDMLLGAPRPMLALAALIVAVPVVGVFVLVQRALVRGLLAGSIAG